MADDSPEIILLTADIVAAHVSNNTLAVGDLPGLIEKVHSALAGLGKEAGPDSSGPREPAVPLRSSVKRDSIACLIDGTRHRILTRHLTVAHGMTPDEYRKAFRLKPDYPMSAPSSTEKRKALARKIGFGSKVRSARRRPAAPKGRGSRKS